MNRPLLRSTLAIALLAVTLAACGSSYQFQGGVLKPTGPASPISLTDQNGQAFSLAAQKGKLVFLYFGYTTCPDACPTTLSEWSQIKTDLGKDADRVEFVFITIDPDRDTQAKLKQYLDFFDPAFIGLTGAPETLAAIRTNYGIIAQREDYPNSATKYLFNHTTSFWIVDRDGKLRLTYPLGVDPAIVEADVKHLL